MKLRRGSILTMIAVPAVVIGLAACGGSSNSSSSTMASSASATTSGGSGTISTKSIGGVGTVLVDSNGNALYTNNQDSGSKIVCTGTCNSIWPALMASGKPTSSNSAVQAKLGMLNGQVTYNGKPLYTFVSDSPGQASGNGQMDNFNGTSFTWTAATTSGSAGAGAAATPTTSSNTSSGGSSGGYGY